METDAKKKGAMLFHSSSFVQWSFTCLVYIATSLMVVQ